MNIWLVTIGEPLPTDEESKKLRTAILAQHLVARGHSVTLFASAFDHLKKKWAFDTDRHVRLGENYDLYVLKGTGYKNNISLQRFIDHRLIAKKFSMLAPQLMKPDIIIASMPPQDLAYRVCRFAKKKSIPVLIDIRDPWPDVFLGKVPSFLRGLFKKILFREFYYVKEALRTADGLLATAGTLLEWGLKYAGRRKSVRDKVIYLAQKESKSNRLTNAAFSDVGVTVENKFNVIFIGTFARFHNPLILVDAACKLMAEKNIHFIIAGSGELQPELEKKSAGLSNVTLTGWLNEEEIDFWLSKSNVGVCPTPLYTDILPNKAGTYLSGGLPLISAFQGDLKEMIENENIGMYFPPNDGDALVTCILKIYKDKKLYEQMAANAKKIFDKKFNADKIYEEYANHIELVKGP